LGVSTEDEAQQNPMVLSEIGKIADQYWLEIPKHFPFVILGAHVVMPNHMHGIVIISKEDDRTPDLAAELVETPKLGVSTGGKNEQWHSGTLGVIINQYKRYCTIQARKILPEFAWQSRFHDHIIRNSDRYTFIENYILNNPYSWTDDKFYTL